LQTCAEAGNYELAKDLIMAHDADVDYKDRSTHSLRLYACQASPTVACCGRSLVGFACFGPPMVCVQKVGPLIVSARNGETWTRPTATHRDVNQICG
jgi:hypothetical protein